MEEEVVIIVTKKAQRLSPDSPVEIASAETGITRTFRGPDRYKKARRFLASLAESAEG